MMTSISIMALPLVISVFKPLTTTTHRLHHSTLLRRRRFTTIPSLSATTTPSHSTSISHHSSSSSSPQKLPSLTFQQAIQRLQEYWASVGCSIMQCSNTEVGAGTMNPLTYLRVLGPEPWNVAYVEPSIRPDDSRYGENPNRLQRHTQFQVILKPDPGNSQDLFIRSLSALGIDVTAHDIRFVEDNWESPVLGAWGLGWEIWMDGMEITQFTYFQQAGSLSLSPVSVEITYGLERILMLLQGVDHFKKIKYSDGITYGELFLENEKEMSAYYLEHASVDHLQKHFDFFEEESRRLLSSGLAIPAYDQLLKTSHAFNILDARGFVGVTERARYFGRMRSLARQCAQLWLKTREMLGFPLGFISEPDQYAVPKDVLKAACEKVHDHARTFVLEIGTEELPPQDVVDASKQLKDLILQLLERQRLKHGEVQVFGTARRLVVSVENLITKQTGQEVEVRGPPVSKAFDQEGNPTKAAEGFSRKNSVPLDLVYRKVDGKTEYVYARIKESSRHALEVLSEDLPATIAKISFPKTMRWNSQVMFSRPIRWILALHGDVVVPFWFAGVMSGNSSCGLRNTTSAIVQIENAESYSVAMRNAGVNVVVEDRKKKIVEQSNTLAESVNGQILIPKGLLDEVVNLVEAPIPVLGKFKETFLDLPKDLLTMVMQKHQKYFAVCDSNGQLLPYFIAVANGAIDEATVRKGNEAVLRARYEDAKFFYELDTRKRFSEFREQLKNILFHEKLGTMLDKMTRVENMVTKLSCLLDINEDTQQTIREAASLAMSDLATSVVTEFTALSGVMGRHYALRDGYSEQVVQFAMADLVISVFTTLAIVVLHLIWLLTTYCVAIFFFFFFSLQILQTAEAVFEITLPRFSGDIVPKSDAGIVLAIADRLDSLVGLFTAGCQPSSTNDPFGLRRISYGLVQLLVEKNKNLDFKEALELAAGVQPIKVNPQVIDEVRQFVTRRLEQFLVDKGVSAEIVRSILAERANFPCLAAKSAYKMEELSKGELFPKVVEAYSRPTRIVRGKEIECHTEVDESAFETNEERVLWNAFSSVKKSINPGLDIDDFVEISSQLIQPLEDFFNNVFVMVDDAKIRNNRLALLKGIAELPKGIADLTLLPGF
ncbi:glycine--tRNA ligase, chloroplastic/mitochondrial 2 isoform X1 [Trifolium pratense]|uniref:glycine--tRNA ligase, chloroplastic/mitochondrial 2 isoform X1 n=1 Tax=Trifolium pratense TaxID=57577 RepID=UPI001E6929CC|nr:glycine--tRNA ligase, chloroplastic/mitochondrial 2 isoform X1 [Trifolium pratense]